MKTKIEIHDNGNDSGTFKVWAKIDGVLRCATTGQSEIQNVLNRKQEEDFWLQDSTKYAFMIPTNTAKEFFNTH